MRRSFALVLAFTWYIAPRAAQADGHPDRWVEVADLISSSGDVLQLDAVVFIRNEKLQLKPGAFIMVNAAPGSFRAEVGPTIKPLSWLEVGAGVGFELADNKAFSAGYRVFGLLRVEHKHVSLLQFVEHGLATGFWHKTELNFPFGRMAGIGVLAQSDAGAGPRIECRIPHSPLTVWGAVLLTWLDPVPVAGMLGVRLGL